MDEVKEYAVISTDKLICMVAEAERMKADFRSLVDKVEKLKETVNRESFVSTRELYRIMEWADTTEEDE